MDVDVDFDRENDVVYISLKKEIAYGESVRQYILDKPDVAGEIILDIDKDGRLLAIEFLHPTIGLPEEFLAAMEDTE